MNIQNIEKKEKNMATFEVKVPADVFDNAVNEVYKKNKSRLPQGQGAARRHRGHVRQGRVLSRSHRDAGAGGF